MTRTIIGPNNTAELDLLRKALRELEPACHRRVHDIEQRLRSSRAECDSLKKSEARHREECVAVRLEIAELRNDTVPRCEVTRALTEATSERCKGARGHMGACFGCTYPPPPSSVDDPRIAAAESRAVIDGHARDTLMYALGMLPSEGTDDGVERAHAMQREIDALKSQLADWKARALEDWARIAELEAEVAVAQRRHRPRTVAELMAKFPEDHPTSTSSAGEATGDGPWVITRRDAHGRRFWSVPGDDNRGEWLIIDEVGSFASMQYAGVSTYTSRDSAESAKPRGSKVVRLSDVPALLADDAKKARVLLAKDLRVPAECLTEEQEEARDFPGRDGGDLEDQVDAALREMDGEA